MYHEVKECFLAWCDPAEWERSSLGGLSVKFTMILVTRVAASARQPFFAPDSELASPLSLSLSLATLSRFKRTRDQIPQRDFEPSLSTSRYTSSNCPLVGPGTWPYPLPRFQRQTHSSTSPDLHYSTEYTLSLGPFPSVNYPHRGLGLVKNALISPQNGKSSTVIVRFQPQSGPPSHTLSVLLHICIFALVNSGSRSGMCRDGSIL